MYVIGPGLVVNLGPKANWGRATRPDFRVRRRAAVYAAAAVGDECARNCSVVSGEAAAATALGIALLVVLRHLRPRLPARHRRWGTWAAVAIPFVGGSPRAVAGRHFLSDVVFAWLIVAGTALVPDWLILRDGWRVIKAPLVIPSEKSLR